MAVGSIKEDDEQIAFFTPLVVAHVTEYVLLPACGDTIGPKMNRPSKRTTWRECGGAHCRSCC